MAYRARVRSLAAVLAAGGVVLATACGGGGAPAGPPPIRIGALIPVTGFGLPYYVAAFNAAVRDVNAHGGVHGRPIVVDNCDDRYDPNQSQACARKLVSDGVIATVANVSGFSMVEAPILDEAGIPQVGSEALSQEDLTLPTAFPLDGGIIHQIAGGLIGMRRRGLHSLFVVATDTPTGRLLVQQTGQFAAAAGLAMAGPGAAYPPLAAIDVGPYVQAAMQSKTDVVLPAMTPAATIGFIMASRQAGAKYLIMVPYGEFSPRDIALMGGRSALTENDVEFAGLPPLSATDRFPAVAQFLADMAVERAAGNLDAAPDRLNGGSLHAWLCVMIVARLAAMSRGSGRTTGRRSAANAR